MKKSRFLPILLFLAATCILSCILFAVSFFSSAPDERVWQPDDSGFSAEEILHRGIYAVSVHYQADGYGIIAFDDSNVPSFRSLDTANTLLPPYTDHVLSRLYVRGDDLPLSFQIYPAGDETDLRIYEVRLERLRTLSALWSALRMSALCLIAGGLFLFIRWCLHTASAEKRRTACILIAVTLIGSAGFMIGYLSGGQDVEFHLGRIGALAQGIREGRFPVRMYPLFENDYGYPLGILYGDLFLYPSVLLHLLGMPLWKCYVFYAVLMNALTAFLSWLSFRTITESSSGGLIGSIVYTLSSWRMIDLYVRAAAGEYAAMAFLPLLAAGFWILLRPDSLSGKDQGRKAACFLVTGYTGILQTHLLTSVMASFFAGLICLVFLRRLLRNGHLKTLLLSALATFLLNLGFLVPFLDMYSATDLTVRHQNLMIQAEGAYPAQLFLPTGVTASSTASLRESPGMSGEMPMHMGILFLLLLLLTLYRAVSDKEAAERRRWAVLGGTSLLALWMSTCYFPYDLLARSVPALASVIGAVQFPWRYLVIATLLLSVSASLMTAHLEKPDLHPFTAILTAVMVLGSIWSAGSLISDKLTTGEVVIRPLNVSQIMSPLIDNDLLYRIEGMDTDIYSDRSCHPSEEVHIRDFSRVGIDCLLQADNPSDSDGYVDLPLTAYRGFIAKGPDGRLQLAKSSEHRLRVLLPAGFSGSIRVTFSSPLLWRAAEILSLLFAAGILGVLVYRHKKERGALLP